MNLHLSFHTLITLAYTIPNIYLFLRIWHRFIEKGFRIWYTLIYLCLVLIYPARNFLPEWEILDIISGYLLPFFLYLFLFMLAFDIFLLLNLIFRFIPAGILRSPSVRKKSLAILLCLSFLVVLAGVINFNTIRTSEYTIELQGKTTDLDKLRIAFVADFHLQERTGIHFVERFTERIGELKPDILIFGGDIIEGDSDDGNIKEFETVLSKIQTRYGAYAVLGNHEYYAGHDDGNFFKRAGISLLCDTTVVFGNSFCLTGRYDSHFNERKPVNELMTSIHDTLPAILVDHRPTEIDGVAGTKADVQLSGHTHNGQLFPINLITRKVYELSWGYMKKGNTHFFVTSGIRLWGPHVRTTGKSEIMVIDIGFN